MGELKVRRRKSRSPQIGDMRERIIFNRRSLEPPAFNSASMVQTLVPYSTKWAKVESVQPDKVFDNVNLAEKIGFIFTTRYFEDSDLQVPFQDLDPGPAVKSRFVITYDNQNYRIRAVEDPDKRKRFLWMFCTLLGGSTEPVNK
jgi:SPP1 family predicted phage head-tail adaptor